MRDVRPALALAAALSLGAVAAGEAESPTAPPTGAATPAEEPAQSPDSAPSDESAPERNEPQSQERLAAPEIFTPSEHISEDIAVPFPVDI